MQSAIHLLTIDQDSTSAFTVGTVYTVGGEICWDDPNETECYWNEDNTIHSIPIANDAYCRKWIFKLSWLKWNI